MVFHVVELKSNSSYNTLVYGIWYKYVKLQNNYKVEIYLYMLSTIFRRSNHVNTVSWCPPVFIGQNMLTNRNHSSPLLPCYRWKQLTHIVSYSISSFISLKIGYLQVDCFILWDILYEFPIVFLIIRPFCTWRPVWKPAAHRGTPPSAWNFFDWHR